MARAVVRNLDEVQRAFLDAGQELRAQRSLKIAAIVQPVVTTAERLTIERTHTARVSQWGQMRMGESNGGAWVAPVARGTRVERKKRRPFAQTLLDRAMIPAVNQNTPRIVREFDRLLAQITRGFNRG